jgi:hypothetical protein
MGEVDYDKKAMIISIYKISYSKTIDEYIREEYWKILERNI